jgi:hypothetical protein
MYMDHMADIIGVVMDKMMPVILGFTSPVDLMVNPQPQPWPVTAAPALPDSNSGGTDKPTIGKAGKSKGKVKGKAPAGPGQQAAGSSGQAAATNRTDHAQAHQVQQAIDHRGLMAGACAGEEGGASCSCTSSGRPPYA